MYDLGLGAYWAVLDYPKTVQSSVQLAGPGLIVWSEGRVRRVGLSGNTEATLLEQSGIESVRVSPDGEKVAFMLGAPPTIVVLDSYNGDERLRVASTASLLAPLRAAASGPGPVLGTWSRDSTGLSVVWGEQTGLLSLDGDLRMLPGDWDVSPDLRYAIRLGESAEGTCFNRHDCRPTWESFDVVEVATSKVLWTVSGTEDVGLAWYFGDSADGWWRPTGTGWSGEPRFVAFTETAGGSKMIDATSGKIYPLQYYRSSLPREVRRLLEGRAWSDCRGRDLGSRSVPCQVWYDERVVLEGASGWTQYIGFIESAGGLVLHGVTTMDVAPEPSVGKPPARAEMVGPLLLYAVWGGPTYVGEDAALEEFARRSDVAAVATWRLMAYDEGTGLSWLALQDQHHFSWWGFSRGNWENAVQGAREGFVSGGPEGLRFVTPTGQPEKLLREHSPAEFRVSPDGRRVAARYHGGGLGPDGLYNPPRTLVFDLESGDAILRVVHDEIPSAVGLPPAEMDWSVWGLEWTSDSSAVVLEVVDDAMGYGGTTVAVIARLDGTLHLVPCEVSEYSHAPRCYAQTAGMSCGGVATCRASTGIRSGTAGDTSTSSTPRPRKSSGRLSRQRL